MTPAQFKRIRRALGLSLRGVADALGISDIRAIRRWEDGSKPVSGPAAIALRYFMKFGTPDQVDLPPEDEQP